MAPPDDEYMEEEQGRQLLDEFLRSVSEDPFAVQALSDALAEGKFPVADDGTISFGLEGLEWMEERENQLRKMTEN